jgi:hypothetical protein
MKVVNKCFGNIGRARPTIFSTLDFTHGFWQMPVKEQSRQLTVFSIPALGQFEWVEGPMGLLSCPVAFQQLLELAVTGLVNINEYIIDLLVHSKTN